MCVLGVVEGCWGGGGGGGKGDGGWRQEDMVLDIIFDEEHLP